MKWEKKGLIYCSSGKFGFDISHCHKPTPLIIDEDTLRVYFGVRDTNGKSRTTFVDLDIGNLKNIKYIHDKPEIYYHIKYATSNNGIDWKRNNISCIKPDTLFEATARPSVLKDNGMYKMWYSRRDIINFRTDNKHSYRAGYAESIDGKSWIRLDNLVGIDISEKSENMDLFDDESIAYPYVIKLKNELIMLYNGNGFGKTGFGYAVLKKSR